MGSDQQQFHRAGAEFGGDHAACQHHEDQRDQADGGYGGIQQPQEGIGFHRLGVVFQPFFRYADIQLQFFFSVGVEEAGVILSAQQTEAVSFDAVEKLVLPTVRHLIVGIHWVVEVVSPGDRRDVVIQIHLQDIDGDLLLLGGQITAVVDGGLLFIDLVLDICPPVVAVCQSFQAIRLLFNFPDLLPDGGGGGFIQTFQAVFQLPYLLLERIILLVRIGAPVGGRNIVFQQIGVGLRLIFHGFILLIRLNLGA